MATAMSTIDRRTNIEEDTIIVIIVAETKTSSISMSLPARYNLSINNPYVPSFWHAQVLWLLFVISNPHSSALHFLYWWSQNTQTGKTSLPSVWFNLWWKRIVRGTESLEWLSDIAWTNGILWVFLFLRSNRCLKFWWEWIFCVSIDPKENEISCELITIRSEPDISITLEWIWSVVSELKHKKSDIISFYLRENQYYFYEKDSTSWKIPFSQVI